VPRRVTLLIGTNKGLFTATSDERHGDWRVDDAPALAGWDVTALLGHGGRLYAATTHLAYGASIRTSDDRGRTWAEIEHGPAFAKDSGHALTKIWQLASGAASEPDTLYAGTEDPGLFVSRDRGTTWGPVDGLTAHPTRPQWSKASCPLCVHTILADPRDARRVWVAVSAAGVLETRDGGASWDLRNAGLPPIRSDAEAPHTLTKIQKLAHDSSRPEALVQQNHHGAFRSGDGGDTWQRIDDGLPTDFGFPVAVAPATGDAYLTPLLHDGRYFKDGRVRVARLRRGATRWELLDRGLPTEPQYVGVLRDSLATDELEVPGVYFGTTQGTVFVSHDAGDTWDAFPQRFGRVTCLKTWVTG